MNIIDDSLRYEKIQNFDMALAKIRYESKNTKELGDKFERLIFNFFKKDRTYKNRFSKVWFFKDWPGKNRGDRGIDLIAQESENGEYVGIQCKCYANNTPLDYDGVAKFLTSCNEYMIKRRIFVCTSDKITRESEIVIRENNIQFLNKSGLRASSILNWNEHFDKIIVKKPKKLRPDQKKVHDDVITGFQSHNRGKMLMACGTGKTLTSLRIIENLRYKLVLYLVPSISLIQQTMREWSDNSLIKCQYIAVCSDQSAGRDEGGQIYELERPPSTDQESFVEQISKRDNYDATIIFSTYQSIDKVAGGFKDIGDCVLDIILCDEAHKTATKKYHIDEQNTISEINQFAKVHDDEIIHSKKRLYMTATPRIYDSENDHVFSMDNETIFGPTFSTISFYNAVHGENPVLSDFKVKIAVLPEDRLPTYMGIVGILGDEDADVDKRKKAKLLEHKAKYAAAWHGILKPDDEALMNKPLQKVIVFTNTIEKSELFAGIRDKQEHGSFKTIADEFNKHYNIFHNVETRHIDGSMRSYQRRIDLDWLNDSDKEPTQTRIISNAKCLSEGVDVPSLDGIIFMEPKKSTVDVVQSVGRVMRKSIGKEYGYIILPVVVPGGTTADEILTNSNFSHVWEVINALRSHDPRLIAELSSAGLTSKPDPKDGMGTPRITVDFLGIDPENEQKLYGDLTLAMRSKLVKKIGTVDYVKKYGAVIGNYAKKIEEIINNMYHKSEKTKRIIDCFHKDMQIIINMSVTHDVSIKMISQHVILKHVFDNLFYDDFISHNPVSKKLDSVLKSMKLGSTLAELGDFYEDVRRETEVIKNAPKNEIHERRQEFIKKIYGSFISSAEKRSIIEKGIVYTPTEIVNFVINSVQEILKTKMMKTFDDDVHILEPFVGTGTFFTQLINSGLIDKSLEKKYHDRMYANELVLLAYYVAAINLETTYFQRIKKLKKIYKYSPFRNINYTDTFTQNPLERTTGLIKFMSDDELLKDLKDRISSQNQQCIEVIIGNPPWGKVKQSKQITSKYNLEKRVSDTYKTNTTSSKNKLHDLYIRALRWSTDRIGECGIIAFVLNGSFIENPSFEGLRKSLYNEFSEIWCFDLLGEKNVKDHGRNIFEYPDSNTGGTTARIAILFLLKLPNTQKCKLHYGKLHKNDHSGQSKRDKIKELHSIKSVSWENITPNTQNQWINKINELFHKFHPIISDGDLGVFKKSYGGPGSGRDPWAYHTSYDILSKNMSAHITYMNERINKLDQPKLFEPTKAHWDTHLAKSLQTHGMQKFSQNKILKFTYRPFFNQYGYYDRNYVRQPGYMPYVFPKKNTENLLLIIPTKFKNDFSVMVTDHETDLEILYHAKFFPLYIYDKGIKYDNITDNILNEFICCYDDKKITKLDIFCYIYAILHHPKYKSDYANNLLVENPRIPLLVDFDKIMSIGKQLLNIHTNFENSKEYNLQSLHKIKTFSKIKIVKNKTYDEEIYLDGVKIYEKLPKINYTVSGRTPLNWFIYKCMMRSPSSKIAKIKNNPLEYMTFEELESKIKQLIYIGVESDICIAKLPSELKIKHYTSNKPNRDMQYQLIDKSFTRKKNRNVKRKRKITSRDNYGKI